MKTKKAPIRLGSSKQLADQKAKEAEAAGTEVANAAKAELRDMAVEMPHGQGKRFLQVVTNLRRIKAQKKALGKEERGERAALKEMKVQLKEFDHVFKLAEMETEDMVSFESGVALLKEQFGLKLSVHQEALKEEVLRRREAARDAMIDASGGDTGKEIGSGVYGAKTDPEIVNAPAAPKPPAKNETFRPISAAAH